MKGPVDRGVMGEGEDALSGEFVSVSKRSVPDWYCVRVMRLFLEVEGLRDLFCDLNLIPKEKF